MTMVNGQKEKNFDYFGDEVLKYPVLNFKLIGKVLISSLQILS